MPTRSPASRSKIDRAFDFRRQRPDQEKDDLRVVRPVALDGFVTPSSSGREFGRDLVEDAERAQRGKLRFVAKIRVGTAAEHRYRLAHRVIGAKLGARFAELTDESPRDCRARQLHRFAGERELKTVEVYQHGQAHACVFRQPKRDQGEVEHFLASRAVQLQESRVASCEDILVVGLQCDRRGQAS